MKIRTYEFKYNETNIIGVESFNNLVINIRYVTHMTPFWVKENKFKDEYYWLFHEQLNGMVIDKKTYTKIKKRLE